MKKLIGILALTVAIFGADYNNDKYYEVEHVYSWTDGWVHVWLKKGLHNCPNKKYANRYLLDPNSSGFKEKFSILLSAKVSAQPVKLAYTCVNDIPRILAVRF